MINKRTLFFLLLLSIFVVGAISTVTASDLNSTDVQTSQDDETALEQIDSNQDEIQKTDENQENILTDGPKSYSDLNRTINGNTDSLIVLNDDYTYNEDTDSAFLNGVRITRSMTIDGNGHTINGISKSGGFYANATVLFKNIKFIYCGDYDKACAELWTYDGRAITSHYDVDNFYADVDVINCTFEYCCGVDGGAISGATARDCNFSNCRGLFGGAMFDTNAYNCRFLNNHATCGGGAMEYGTAYNCYFEGNVAEASYDVNIDGGGAIYDGSCVNCTFVRNSARYGGAIFHRDSSIIKNSTFIGNSATKNGGAIYMTDPAIIIDCDFKQNKASTAGAIYSWSSSSTVVCCSFSDNTGGNTYNCNMEFPSFSIASNPLEVQYPNVSIPINLSYSYTYYQYNYVNYYNGVDVAINIYNSTNSELISTDYVKSGSQWVSSLNPGTYNLQLSSTINGNSFTRSYTLKVVGYQTLINLSSPTLDISSNIYVARDSESYLVVTFTDTQDNPLKGHYIKLTREGYYTKTYPTDENGQARIPLHTFEPPAYPGSGYYLTLYGERSGLYEPSETLGFNLYMRESGVNDPKSFSDLNRTINNNTDSVIVLNDDYVFNIDTDEAFLMGIAINRAVTIEGNGHTIEGCANAAKGFETGNYEITFNNITFINLGKTTNYNYNGGAIHSIYHNTKAQNCEFIACQGYNGGALYYIDAYNCTFKNCICNSYGDGGGAVYNSKVVNCTFEANNAQSANGGAMAIGSAINCTFKNNRAWMGGATANVNVLNSIFIANSAMGSGGAFYSASSSFCINCTFINNTAGMSDVRYGGAVYASKSYGTSKKGTAIACYFENNGAAACGGAYGVSLVLCKFKDNYVTRQGYNYQKDYGDCDFPDLRLMTPSVSGNCPVITLPLDLSYYSIPYVFSPNYYYYFEDIGINFTLYKDGNIIESYQGVSNIPYDLFLEPGTYTVKYSIADATYNNKIGSSYATGTLIVKGYKTVINASDLVIKIGNTTNITATLLGDYYQIPLANKTVTITFDGNPSTLRTDDKGQVNISIPVLPARSYPIQLYFNGDGVYEGCVNDISVLVDKIHTQISSENVSTFYNEGKLTANLTDEYGNPLSNADVLLTVSYIQRPLKTNSKGQIEFYLEGLGLAEGNHEAKFQFGENSTHADSAKSINVEIYRLKSRIDADNISYVYGESGILTAYLRDYAGNPLSNYMMYLVIGSSVDLQLTDSNGQVDFNLSGKFYPGNFDGNIYFDNVNRYYGSSIPVNVVVNKISTEISAPDVTCSYGEDKYLVVTLKDMYGNPIANETVFVNFNIKLLTAMTDDDGQAMFLIDLPPMSYDASVGFSGDKIYMSNSSKASVVVTQVNEKIPTEIISNDLTTVYNEGKYLTITLKDNYGDVMSGKELVINFNGQTKTYKTDKKGQVKLATAALVPGKYPAKVMFMGDNNYQASSFSVNLIIKKATPYLFPSNKKFNKKTKVKKYKVTLKTNRNVAMKNVKLTLKVKGKTYTAKTNKKGQAIFKLKKLTKKGTYKAVITYSGSSCYNKVVKNAKIKVK